MMIAVPLFARLPIFYTGHNNVACILSNALSFYGQFLHATDSSIQQLARPLQKEFKVLRMYITVPLERYISTILQPIAWGSL